jgi:hypothetical protein
MAIDLILIDIVGQIPTSNGLFEPACLAYFRGPQLSLSFDPARPEFVKP